MRMTREDFLHRYGPWAVVTGASEGIGRAFAVRLAEAGVHLVLAARRGPLLDSLAQELRQRCAVEVRCVAGDLVDPQTIDALLAASAPLDVGLLIAAAGYGTSGPLIEAALERELHMVDLNCRTVAALSAHFGRRLAERRRGGLVLMSSLLAFQGVPRAANYAATKAYVQSLAEGLRLELAPQGVDVLSCAPGPIHSGFAQRAAMQMRFAQTPDDVVRDTLRALGRRGTVRPGWLSKLLEWSLSLLPRWGRVRVMGLVMADMTRPALPAPVDGAR